MVRTAVVVSLSGVGRRGCSASVAECHSLICLGWPGPEHRSSRGRAVWASTFVRYAEVVDGADGHEMPGWPYAFSHSTFHASPLNFDVDGDGVDEMLLLTFDAEVVFLNERGLPLRGRGFKLPKLRVRKEWYEGLHDVHTNPFKRGGGHGLATRGGLPSRRPCSGALSAPTHLRSRADAPAFPRSG